MSSQITAAFVRDYKSDVQHLLQTQGSQLREYVNWATYTGEGGRPVNQIGVVVAQKKTVRHANTPYAETPHASRWVEPSDYEVPADLIDTQDKLRILFDPAGHYQKAHAMALGRSLDAEIVGAFFATSKTGPQGGSTEAFDTAYQIAAGGTGLTVAKLRTALRLLMAAKNRLDIDPPIIAITAKQHDNLLNEPEVINRDYNSALVMEDGKVRRFLGFRFVHLEELGVDGAGATRCPCWVKSGMHGGMWNDVVSHIDVNMNKSYATQVYSTATFGATRLEQGKVIEILAA